MKLSIIYYIFNIILILYKNNYKYQISEISIFGYIDDK